MVASATTATQRARLTDALRAHASLRFTDSYAELANTLRGTIEHIDAVVLSVGESSEIAVATVRDIAAHRPRTAIVVYLQAGAQSSTGIRTLAMAGAHQFLFAGMDDTGVAFRAVLDAARQQCAAEYLLRHMAPLIPAPLLPMVEAALARPESITTVPALAGALGVHRKTLFNRCEHAEFLPPAELLAWTRLALVGYFLDNTGCTIETIALQLDYPSPTALRNTIKRYAGQRATELRRAGAVTGVLGALARRIRIHRPEIASLHLV